MTGFDLVEQATREDLGRIGRELIEISESADPIWPVMARMARLLARYGLVGPWVAIDPDATPEDVAVLYLALKQVAQS
jgi:hypothetical protein